MSEENREALAERNRQRARGCKKCGAIFGLEVVDGSKCDGLPGINYRLCLNCGHAQPLTKRARKERLR